LAFAIPLMTVTGDSCEYLNKAEADVSGTLNISATAGRIIQSCLLNTPMSDALNLTQGLGALSELSFADITNPSFNTPTLDALLANVSTLTAATAFTDWPPNLVDLDLQAITAITSGLDGSWWSRTNISSMDTTIAPYNTNNLPDKKTAVLAHMRSNRPLLKSWLTFETMSLGPRIAPWICNKKHWPALLIIVLLVWVRMRSCTSCTMQREVYWVTTNAAV